MRVFVLDNTQLRDWKDMVNQSDGQFGGVYGWNDRDKVRPANNDLVVIHRTDFAVGENLNTDVSKWVNDVRCYYLLIAGYDLRSRQAEDGRGYRRGAAVAGSGIDRVFQRCLRDMIKELENATIEKRQPNWKYIEPFREPNLSALIGYLILRLPNLINPDVSIHVWEELTRRDSKSKYPRSWDDYGSRTDREKEDLAKDLEGEVGFAEAVQVLLERMSPMMVLEVPRDRIRGPEALLMPDKVLIDLQGADWYLKNRSLLIELARRYL